ncbi:hypothetical protein [Fischerella sp.]|uniref:hypothetical protein n=1 Tax=Fischerella sp. TaxID=1191 RepID=UPI0025B96944|nr:hypothetical protein [Fischerella sp.]
MMRSSWGEDKTFFALLTQLQQQAAELTRAFISFCQGVYVAKLKSDRTQWKEARESLGWASSTATPYAKIGEWLAEIPEHNLDLLDIKTLMSLCCEKYRPILEQLQQERLMVREVRDRMSEINTQIKEQKPPKPVMEWKRAKTGDRSLLIRLEDPEAATELEARYKQSCLPLPSFIRELLKGAGGFSTALKNDNARAANNTTTEIKIGDRVKVVCCEDGWLGCSGVVTNAWNKGYWVLLDDVQRQGLTTRTFFKTHQIVKLE